MLKVVCGRTSDRKLRLFAVACCRHAWGCLESYAVRQAVEVAERFADGLADAQELAEAERVLWLRTESSSRALSWACWVTSSDAWYAAQNTSGAAGQMASLFARRKAV